jgi:hypothetical protein
MNNLKSFKLRSCGILTDSFTRCKSHNYLCNTTEIALFSFTVPTNVTTH